MGVARLVVDGEEYLLEDSVCIIGRDPLCNIIMDDQEMSRKHAIIVRGEEGYLLVDFKSSNGVYVNDERIEQCYLHDGDEIRMGETVFTFREKDEGDSGVAAGEGAGGSRHSMDELGTSLRQDTILMLDKREVSRAGDAFEKLLILYQIGKIINSVLDRQEVLNKVIDLALKVMKADRGFIMLKNENGKLVPTVARQMENMMAHDGPITISRNIVMACVRERKPILTQDALVDQRFQTSGSIQMYNIRSAMCVPLNNKNGELIGVLYVDNRIQSHCFREEDLQLLTAFADQAAIAIENANLYMKVQEEARIRNNLSRYLSPDLVDRIMKESVTPELGGERVEATMLFADIRGFTSFSESRSSKEVIEFLNEYLSQMTRVIFAYRGTLDKYMGDGIMAIFGPPFNPKNAPVKAVQAALMMQYQMTQLNERWQRMGYPRMSIGIGINTGEVTAGNIGYTDEKDSSKSRLDFTVIGDAVNTAARLESIAGPGEILITEETCRKLRESPLGAQFVVENRGEQRVKGKQKPVVVYCVKGLRQK